MYKFLRFFGWLIFLLGCGASSNDNQTMETPVVEQTLELPPQSQLWIFIMAGQSNMAGRATIEAQDIIQNDRILTITSDNEVVLAKEPLHFYEPSGAGLDCGMSFGREMLKNIPEHTSILLIPTAVGGSSISQWINNDVHRGVKLLSNLRERLRLGLRHGELKGILWHQGESDAHHEENIKAYKENLGVLFSEFRKIAKSASLPIVSGKLGSFATEDKQGNWNRINEAITAYSLTDHFCEVVETADLEHEGDRIHFNSEAQRTLGKRYAETILELIN